MQTRIRTWFLAALVILACAATSPAVAAPTEGEHRVDINTASAAELASLPGIGDSKAQAIVDYRTAEPFRTVEDLKKVKGIGDKTLESLRPNLMVSDAASGKK